jgi:hypothetical protein
VTLGAEGAGSAAHAGIGLFTVQAANIELPNALAAFLEACAKLANEAAARGDVTTAQELIAKAARAAALR